MSTPAPRPSSEIVAVPLAELDCTPAASVRAGGRNPEVVSEYADAYQSDWPPPPPTAFGWFHEGKPRFVLGDGGYRVAAHAHLEHSHADCLVAWCDSREEAESRAYAVACAANEGNGVRRSQADRRASVHTAFARSEHAESSDREIARVCRVSKFLVATVRKELTGQEPKKPVTRYRASGPARNSKDVPPVTQAMLDGKLTPELTEEVLFLPEDAQRVILAAPDPNIAARDILAANERAAAVADAGGGDDGTEAGGLDKTGQPVPGTHAARRQVEREAAAEEKAPTPPGVQPVGWQPRPDTPVVPVPLGVAAVRDRAKFVAAVRAVRAAEAAILACFEGLGGEYLRRACRYREDADRGDGVWHVPHVRRWAALLNATAPDPEPCWFCHGRGGDEPGRPCRSCGGLGFSSDWFRDCLNDQNQNRTIDELFPVRGALADLPDVA